jgi:hypothetical protein
MPIHKYTFNMKTFFGGEPDPQFDQQRTDVVSPDKSTVYDFETFEYFIQTWQKSLTESRREQSIFRDALIGYQEIVLEPFYIFLKMNFTSWAEENISEFVYDGKITYYLKDSEEPILADTIQKLYNFIYN